MFLYFRGAIYSSHCFLVSTLELLSKNISRFFVRNDLNLLREIWLSEVCSTADLKRRATRFERFENTGLFSFARIIITKFDVSVFEMQPTSWSLMWNISTLRCFVIVVAINPRSAILFRIPGKVRLHARFQICQILEKWERSAQTLRFVLAGGSLRPSPGKGKLKTTVSRARINNSGGGRRRCTRNILAESRVTPGPLSRWSEAANQSADARIARPRSASIPDTRYTILGCKSSLEYFNTFLY